MNRIFASSVRMTFLGLFCIGSFGFIALLCSTAGPFRSVEGHGVSAQEANARLWHCLVPDDATNVSYTSRYISTRVECSIEPESFRLWSERNGWHLEPIPEGKPQTTFSVAGLLVDVEVGFQFNERKANRTLGYIGVYDSRNKRAYVAYISR